MDELHIFLLITTAIFAVLFARAWLLIKKQRKVSNDLVKNRDALITERDKLIHKLELESLKFQVSPHSLRNTLNVVKYYTETANLAIGRLTNVLDFLLYESGVDEIALKDELRFVRNFHELMKIRTSELVVSRFNENISGQTAIENLHVPPMITAYFLENAYKHGELAREGVINVNISFEKNTLVYIVENTIRAEAVSPGMKGGIGLKNMKKRLDILYNGRYVLNTENNNNLYRAELRITY